MKRHAPAPDPVLALLANLRIPDLKFVAATDEAVAGLDLAETGNRAYGKNVYIATSGTPNVSVDGLRIGVLVSVGARERYSRGELRCEREGPYVAVAVYDHRGFAISRVLCAQCNEDEIDEARFTWLSPKELYCTPWSDSDPAICQVVTVERLRRWARREPTE
jgi:hypothetical protein